MNTMLLWCIDCDELFHEEKTNVCCKSCGSYNIVDLKDGHISTFDTSTLRQISRDKNFVQAMIDLCEKDPIEYQLKMSQFKANLNQQKQQAAQNLPHCPHCGSTNIKKISTTSRVISTGLFGLGSRKVGKIWVCSSCGHMW